MSTKPKPKISPEVDILFQRGEGVIKEGISEISRYEGDVELPRVRQSHQQGQIKEMVNAASQIDEKIGNLTYEFEKMIGKLEQCQIGKINAVIEIYRTMPPDEKIEKDNKEACLQLWKIFGWTYPEVDDDRPELTQQRLIGITYGEAVEFLAEAERSFLRYDEKRTLS